MLKKIGTAARLQIERMLGTKIYLDLFVKVEPGWRDSRGFIEELDWRRQLQERMLPPKLPLRSDQTENAPFRAETDK
jgi:hypothetical protein